MGKKCWGRREGEEEEGAHTSLTIGRRRRGGSGGGMEEEEEEEEREGRGERGREDGVGVLGKRGWRRGREGGTRRELR